MTVTRKKSDERRGFWKETEGADQHEGGHWTLTTPWT